MISIQINKIFLCDALRSEEIFFQHDSICNMGIICMYSIMLCQFRIGGIQATAIDEPCQRDGIDFFLCDIIIAKCVILIIGSCGFKISCSKQHVMIFIMEIQIYGIISGKFQMEHISGLHMQICQFLMIIIRLNANNSFGCCCFWFLHGFGMRINSCQHSPKQEDSC